MRDGQTIKTHEVSGVSREVLIREMVGRDLNRIFPPRQSPLEEVVLGTRLSAARDFSEFRCRFDAAKSSAWPAWWAPAAATWLARSSAPTESMRVKYGSKTGGSIGTHPTRRYAAEWELLTEDQKSLGLLLNMTVRENITLARLARVSRALFVSRAREKDQVLPLVQSLRIKAPFARTTCSHLSGKRNQQKTIVARWLFAGAGS